MRPVVSKLFIFLMLASAGVAPLHAADIADYHNRVESARAGINALLDNVAQAEIGEKPAVPDSEIFAEVKRRLPATEKIETPIGSVDADNQWFTDGLKAAEAETDLSKRSVILTELDQRLGALSAELDEVQVLASAERSKDEDKQKLAEILNRPEFQRPIKPEAVEKNEPSWLKEFLEWLESLFPKFAPPEGSAEGVTSVARAVIWVLFAAIVLVLLFVLYKLLSAFMPRFRSKKREEREERVILGERIADDQSAHDLFGDAERLAREGDVRGAIRKGYVALLCELSDRKLIGLARHKTNRDYLRDVRSRREIYDPMSGLTGKFERHWYGSQEARPDDWEEFRKTCGETLKTI